MAIKRFEELIAWRRAILFSKHVHDAMKSPSLRRDRILTDQLWRSTVSISSNVAEGFEKYSRVEFSRFLTIAKGSAGEARSQLHISRAVGLLSEPLAGNLIAESEELSRIIGGLRASLARKKND